MTTSAIVRYAAFGVCAFSFVFLINYLRSHVFTWESLVASVLVGLVSGLGIVGIGRVFGFFRKKAEA